jgi:hypothetical protein
MAAIETERVMVDDLDKFSDKELIRLVREAADNWFGARALEFLEELIRRSGLEPK